METVKLLIKRSDSVEDVLEALEKMEKKKVIFLCPRNLSFLLDGGELKKIQLASQALGQELVFVATQEFVCSLLKNKGCEAFLKTPLEYKKCPEKKVSDFLERESAKKNKASIAEIFSREKVQKTGPSPAFSTKKIEAQERELPIRGKIFFAFLGAIGLLTSVLFLISPSCVILIDPSISAVPITQNVMIIFPNTVVDPKDELLPRINGIFTENVLEKKDTFPSTGRTYNLTNASGKVTLFNETPTPKVLVPSRLSTPDGLIFRFQNQVTIPPKRGKEPGRLVVSIVADEYDAKGDAIGEKGNISAGTQLVFPALRKELQEQYYAKANQGPLVGGSTLTHYFLQESDIPRAEEILKESLQVQAIESLKIEVDKRSSREKKKFVLLDDARVFQVPSFDAVVPNFLVGEPVQTFEIQAKIKVLGVVFDQSQILSFLNTKVREMQDDRKKLITLDPSSAQYQILAMSEDTNNPWVKLSVEMQGAETFDFLASSRLAEEWRYKIKKEIVGKSVQDALRILNNFPEIERIADIRISPFWLKKIPTVMDQIRFEAN